MFLEMHFVIGLIIAWMENSQPQLGIRQDRDGEGTRIKTKPIQIAVFIKPNIMDQQKGGICDIWNIIIFCPHQMAEMEGKIWFR